MNFKAQQQQFLMQQKEQSKLNQFPIKQKSIEIEGSHEQVCFASEIKSKQN